MLILLKSKTKKITKFKKLSQNKMGLNLRVRHRSPIMVSKWIRCHQARTRYKRHNQSWKIKKKLNPKKLIKLCKRKTKIRSLWANLTSKNKDKTRLMKWSLNNLQITWRNQRKSKWKLFQSSLNFSILFSFRPPENNKSPEQPENPAN